MSYPAPSSSFPRFSYTPAFFCIHPVSHLSYIPSPSPPLLISSLHAFPPTPPYTPPSPFSIIINARKTMENKARGVFLSFLFEEALGTRARCPVGGDVSAFASVMMYAARMPTSFVRAGVTLALCVACGAAVGCVPRLPAAVRVMRALVVPCDAGIRRHPVSGVLSAPPWAVHARGHMRCGSQGRLRPSCLSSPRVFRAWTVSTRRTP
ncbi:hypothetical protein C8J57DRAFT_1515545 [Mycena rebaudengoi]|nr:hypothetical protein C8J57DRAFT_1515545 [Mycena rebaudengoi]